jgi:hypothetical protein
MRSVDGNGRRVIVLALVLGLGGCGATSHHDPSHTTGRAAHAAEPDHGDRHPEARRNTAPGSGHPGTGSDVDDDEPHASHIQVSDAQSIARASFPTYVAFLYGRLPAMRVVGADPNLRRDLEHGHATTTPAERAARPRVEHLSLSPTGPPVSVVALAIVTTGCCSPSHLSATLEPHGRGWLVIAANG